VSAELAASLLAQVEDVQGVVDGFDRLVLRGFSPSKAAVMVVAMDKVHREQGGKTVAQQVAHLFHLADSLGGA
jgi:hypothetical protein